MNTQKALKPAALGLLGIAALAFAFYAGTQYPIKGDAASQIASREANRPPIMPNDWKVDKTGEAGNPSNEPDDLKADETAEVSRNPVMPDSPNTDATGDASRIPGLPGDPNMIASLQTDGTRIVWLQEADRRTLHKYSFNSDGSLAFTVVYRLDPDGNPLNSKIFDKYQAEIFKGSYGYKKSDGQLVEERFFDSRTKHLTSTGDVIPVCRFIFRYDSHGEALETHVNFPLAPQFGFVEPADIRARVPEGFPTTSFSNPFMIKHENPIEQPGTGQPAIKPADKIPGECQSPPSTSKDGLRPSGHQGSTNRASRTRHRTE